MIYKRPITALKNPDIQEVFFLVTIEWQYVNEINSVPPQSFILFKLRDRLIKRVEDECMVHYLLMRTYNWKDC